MREDAMGGVEEHSGSHKQDDLFYLTKFFGEDPLEETHRQTGKYKKCDEFGEYKKL